ncbi:hypothetical protein YTPLAS18_06170 [Nitrospira sp.]|nr:hypothetical protein YTPLAS18_06170 [Nitrospira sp.]
MPLCEREASLHTLCSSTAPQRVHCLVRMDVAEYAIAAGAGIVKGYRGGPREKIRLKREAEAMGSGS